MPKTLTPQEQWETQFQIPLPGEPRNIGPLETLFQRLLNRTERLKGRFGEILGTAWDAGPPATILDLHSRVSTLETGQGGAQNAITQLNTRVTALEDIHQLGSIQFGAANWNGITGAGYYAVSSGGTGGSGAPPSSGPGLLVVERHPQGGIVQRYHPQNENRVYVRYNGGSGWSAWGTIRGDIPAGFGAPVDTGAYHQQTGQNYPLQPGEVGIQTFSNSSSWAVRVAMASGIYYVIVADTYDVNSTQTNSAQWLPNGATYSNAFIGHSVAEGTVVSAGSYTADRILVHQTAAPSSGTHTMRGLAEFIVDVPRRTILHFAVGFGGNNAFLARSSVYWTGSTTWSTFGTITFPALASGIVIAHRLT